VLTSFLSWFSIIPKGGRYEEIQDTIRRETQDYQGLHGQGLISIRDRKNVGNFKTTRQVLDFEDKGGEEMSSVMIGHAKKINDLHKEIFGAVKMTLDKAIQIGKLLTECKGKIPHGEWMSWMEKNLKFSNETASRYMRVYEHRAEEKFVTMTNLTGVYQSLIEHKPKIRQMSEFDEGDEEDEEDEYLSEPPERNDDGLVTHDVDEITETLDSGKHTSEMDKIKYLWNELSRYEKEVLFKWISADIKKIKFV